MLKNNIEANVGAITAQLQTMFAQDEPGVSILVSLDGEAILEFYAGLANLESGEALNAAHQLGVASLSKQFTGMAVLCLCAEGKLDLAEEASAYFPDLPLDGRVITLRQCLSHTSGLPELTQNERFMADIHQPHTVAQIIDYAFSGEFRSEPGERFIYNNTGYILAVALIEKMGGMRFSQFMEERIFVPLEMGHSYTCDFWRDADRAVQRYEPSQDGYKKAIEMHFSNLIGGGSVVSNVTDLAKWGNALLTGDHLPPNYREMWRSNQLSNGEPTYYGLGMGIDSLEGERYYYHPGMGNGMNSIHVIYPDHHLNINVIRNVSTPKHTSKEISEMIARGLLFR
ncbi:MAG: serine hydrolase domain-containing protein [Anaerolineales bacterium]|jgi:CubicO group peptidase (beta-lactamase class C family)